VTMTVVVGASLALIEHRQNYHAGSVCAELSDPNSGAQWERHDPW